MTNKQFLLCVIVLGFLAMFSTYAWHKVENKRNEDVRVENRELEEELAETRRDYEQRIYNIHVNLMNDFNEADDADDAAHKDLINASYNRHQTSSPINEETLDAWVEQWNEGI